MPWAAFESRQPVRAVVQSAGAGIFQGRSGYERQPEFLHYSARRALDGDAGLEQDAFRDANLGACDVSRQHRKTSALRAENIGAAGGDPGAVDADEHGAGYEGGPLSQPGRTGPFRYWRRGTESNRR